MSSRNMWAMVGRLADVVQIATAIGGITAVVLAALGVDLLSDSNVVLLLSVAAAFGLMGLASLVSAFVRVQRHGSGFDVDGGSTNRLLYISGTALILLAIVTLAFLTFGPPANESGVLFTGV